MNQSQDIAELAKALSAFQAIVTAIGKDSENPFFHSKYASLENIIETIRQPLTDSGLSFSQFPSGENNLTTILMHTSGQWLQATAKMTPKDTSPQSQGSAITYMRRYALSAILGLATEEDDDGNQASTTPKAAIKPKDGSMDVYQKSIAAIAKAKTIGDLAKLGERIDKTTKLNDTQKDALDKLIGKAITALEGNANQGHVE